MKKIKINEILAVFIVVNVLATLIIVIGHIIAGGSDSSVLPLFYGIINGAIVFSIMIVKVGDFIENYIELT